MFCLGIDIALLHVQQLTRINLVKEKGKEKNKEKTSLSKSNAGVSFGPAWAVADCVCSAATTVDPQHGCPGKA